MKNIAIGESMLVQGNRALRSKNYVEAMRCYIDVLEQTPSLLAVIALNIRHARKNWAREAARSAEQRVALVGDEGLGLGAARVQALCELYRALPSHVELVQLQNPLDRHAQAGGEFSVPVHFLDVPGDLPFDPFTLGFVARHPFQRVHLCNPHQAGIALGAMYKLVWGAQVFVDLCDEEPPGTASTPALSTAFELLTTPNAKAQARHGGEIVAGVADLARWSFAPTIPPAVTPRLAHWVRSSVGVASLLTSLADITDSVPCVPTSRRASVEPASAAIAPQASDQPEPELGSRSDRTLLVRPENLEHYFFGCIEQSALFDPDWYLKQYGSVQGIEGNPLQHYLDVGYQFGNNPSTGFDTKYYLESNPDVAAAGVHPFIHYVSQGIRENGRFPLPPPPPEYCSRYSVSEPKYVPRLPHGAGPAEKAVRVFAFYLPQFHPIPENDAWWGPGFTEWTNVKPAKPQFEGHYQPHVPDPSIGYYNLLDRAVQRKQVEMAKQYGVEGFCFYLYWFSGKRLLEQPVDNYLADPSLDLPFCVCWANENWSRRWDGLEQDLLMVQHYSPEDDLSFIAEVSKYLRDPRYIRVDGKPMLMVYRPNLFPNMRETAQRWRTWCRDNGVGEIYLVYPQSFECVDPAEYGFDAATEFPPNNSAPPDIRHRLEGKVENFESKVFDWRVFIDRSETYTDPGYKIFRAATPSWDNTARKKNKGTVFHNSCPKLFAQWLENAFVDTMARLDNPQEQIVFINAWNEWAEGAHLEPDQRYGFAWLQSVRDAHHHALRSKRRVVVVSHDAHPHGAQILCLNFARYLAEQFNFAVDMIVLGEGKMLAKYAKYATVHRLDLATAKKKAIDDLLGSLRRKGAEVAIVNTAVSGHLVPHLKRHGFGVVSLIHEMPGILRSYKLEQQAGKIAAEADRVVFPAMQVQQGFENFIGQSLRQAAVRPQGLYLRGILAKGGGKGLIREQVRAELDLPVDAKIVMCAGYADHRKGFDLFVRASLLAMRQVPNAYALWVGHLDQGFVDESLRLADEAGLRERFLFTGLVERPQPYYVAADVYALTSREDPFPSVVMESLDALTPVVAFKECGGFENLLQRECGILVPAGDYTRYGQALVELLTQPERAFELAVRGKEIVEAEFSFRHYLFDLLAMAGRPLPKVSVVVPNYRYAQYIRQRLETVVRQSYPIYELIVLDDCSPDDSVEVIENFLADCEVPHLFKVNTTNSGSVFKQWRKGVELARGDLVWIAEADDLAEPEFLERLVACFADPQVVLAYSQSKQIDQDDNPLGNDYLAYTDDVGDYWRDDYVVDGREEVSRALSIKNTIPSASGVIFKREVLLDVLTRHGDEIASHRVAGDWVVYLYMALAGKIAFIHRSLNVHRRHTGSVTKKNNHLDEVIAVQRLASQLFDIATESADAAATYIEKLRIYFADTQQPEAREPA